MTKKSKQIIYRADWQDVEPVPCTYIPDEEATPTHLSGTAILPDGKEVSLKHYSFFDLKDLAWKCITQNARHDIVLAGREVESARKQLEKAQEGAGKAAERYRLIHYNDDNPFKEI